MRKLVLLVALTALFALPQTALAYLVILEDFTGDDATVQLGITGDGTNDVTFAVDVLAPGFADIRGIFFDLDMPIPGDLTVAGADVTDWDFSGNVDNLGGGATITPAGPFDAGIEIGTSGIGTDDFYTTTFTISSLSEALVLDDSFGARLTSVGSNRQGSSKLLGNTPPYTPIPVPSAALLGIIGMATSAHVLRRRRKKTANA